MAHFIDPIYNDLSIHFPLTREDQGEKAGDWMEIDFQSTSLSRGKTDTIILSEINVQSFNPLPSHEGRQCVSCGVTPDETFNPLPSHEGRQKCAEKMDTTKTFQSTSLSRGKTQLRADA